MVPAGGADLDQVAQGDIGLGEVGVDSIGELHALIAPEGGMGVKDAARAGIGHVGENPLYCWTPSLTGSPW